MDDGFIPDAPAVDDGFLADPTPPVRDPALLSQQVGRGIVPGFDRLAALAAAGYDRLGHGFRPNAPSIEQLYNERLRAEQARGDQYQRDNPKLSGALRLAGGMLSPAAKGQKALEYVGRLPSALAAAKQGAILGAGYGVADAPADASAADMAASGVAGGVMGGGMGAGVGALAPQGPGGFRMKDRKAPLSVSPAAQRMEAEGIPLTVGQRVNVPDPQHSTTAWDKGSRFIRDLELASAQNAFGMFPEHQANTQAWRQTVLQRTQQPGAKPLPEGTMQAQAEAARRLAAEYEKFASAPVRPELVRELPEKALRYRGRRIDARSKASAKGETANALTVLPEMPSGERRLIGIAQDVAGAGPEGPIPHSPPERLTRGEFVSRPGHTRANEGGFLAKGDVEMSPLEHRFPMPAPGDRLIPGTMRPAPYSGWRPVFEEPKAPPTVRVGDLIRARAIIREDLAAVGERASGQNNESALRHAEGTLSAAIAASLPKGARSDLRGLDRRYAMLKTAERAAPAGKIDWTPKQYAARVERDIGQTPFKRGKGGVSQQSGLDAAEVLEPAPPTGFRVQVAKFMGPFSGGVSRAMNTPRVRSYLFDPQKAVAAKKAMSVSPLVAALRAGVEPSDAP